jgi:transcriptional regulator with XRE-family HTH domain
MVPCPTCKGNGSVPYPAAVGESLRQLRKKSGLTLMQMQERTGLNISLLSRLENGMEKWTYKRVEIFKKVCREQLRSINV